jgi:phage minor structural protein
LIWIFNRDDRLQLICSNELPEALPIITAEMHEVLNGDLNLDFEVPLDHRKAIEIEEGFSAAVQRENGTYELFIISEIKQLKGNESTLQILCRHAVQELKDEVIEYYFADRKEASTVLPALLLNTRWTAGTIENTSIHDITVENQTVLEALTTFIERWEGEVSYSFEISSLGIVKRQIHFLQQQGQDAGRRFEWSQDLESIERTVNEENVKTALIGIGKGAEPAEGGEAPPLYFTDIVSTDPAKPAGQKFVEDPAAKAKWGRINADGSRRNRIGFYIDNEITDAQALLDATWAALQATKVPHVQYKLTVLDLAKIEGKLYKLVSLGDTVAAIDDDLQLQIKARCLEIKHDLIEPERTELILDNFYEVFTAGGGMVADPSIRLDQIEAALNDKLDKGETILTSWLEDEIALVSETILAGGGTVTMNNNDGILVEEDPEGKTGGAIRLLGGTLALANSFDFVNGVYNWRAFGTGEGFLADLVETGFLKFDRSKGGTLALGGEVIGTDAVGNPIYENGSLQVYGSVVEADGRPIVVNLNGDQGGFDKLSIGELTNTQSTNILTSTFDDFLKVNQTATGEIEFYVDPINGNDNNTGIKSEPKLTIQSCINLLPKYLDRNIWIFVMPTLVQDNEILIEGFVGEGQIYIEVWDIGQIRYIRDYLAGSSANNANHWVEVAGIAPDGSTRHAGGNTYPERVTAFDATTGEDKTAQLLNKGRVSNGDTATGSYAAMNNTNAVKDYVQIYLGGLYELSAILSHHYYSDGRTYHGTKVQVSADLNNWYTIFDSERQGEYPETSAGKRHELKYFVLNGKVKVNSCMISVRVNNVMVNGEGVGNPTVDAFHTNYLEMRNSVVFGDPTYSYAVYANGSNLRLIDSEVNFAENSGIAAAYGGRAEIVNVKGSGFPYGLFAHSSAIVAGTGFAPYGSTAHQRWHSGGTMTATWTPTVGVFYKPPIVQKTTTWTANDTQSLFGTNWTLTSYLYQGKRPTEATAWYGVAFFDARSFTELSGRAIRKVRLKLQRSNNTGENTSRKPKIYYNMQTDASGSMQTLKGGHTSSVGFTWGQEKWIDLPISYGEAFRDGTAKSLVLWVGSSESEYMKLEPKATLEITHG